MSMSTSMPVPMWRWFRKAILASIVMLSILGLTSNAWAVVGPANTYSHRDFTTDYTNGFKQLRSDVQIVQTDDSVGYFYADHFFFKGGDGGYAGLQTRLDNGSGFNLGHGAIFTVFLATSVTLIGSGGFALNGTEGGKSFWSIHLPYNWSTGSQYEIVLTEVGPYGGPYTGEVEADIWNRTLNQTTVIGRIQNPTSWKGFRSTSHEQFTEFYTGGNGTCTFPISKAKWARSSARGDSFSFVSSDVESDMVQSGTGCTNSAVLPTSGMPNGNTYGDTTGGNQRLQIVGATS